MVSKRKTNTSWNFWIAILQSEKKLLFHHVTNLTFFFFLGAKPSKSGAYYMFTEYFNVDKLHFKPSITLHVAHGYHIYHIRQCRLKPFLFFGISFQVLISGNFQ